jgi:hypothetical protein
MATYLIRTVEDSECAFEIIGYTNDLTKAKKICAEHNKGAESWQKWIVEELNSITEVPQVEVVSLWKFKYFLDKKTKSLYSWRGEQFFEVEQNQEHELIFENIREGVYCFLCDIYGKENEKEAEKIAEEMIAEYRQKYKRLQ